MTLPPETLTGLSGKDASRHVWLAESSPLYLVVTMDDATSEIYSAFLVAEEGTDSTFRALLEVFGRHGLPLSLYTDRGSHYFHTAEAGGKVDRGRLTQGGLQTMVRGCDLERHPPVEYRAKEMYRERVAIRWVGGWPLGNTG